MGIKLRSELGGIQIQELLAVKHGLKPVLRTVTQKCNAKNIKKVCRKNGLLYMIKPFTQLYGVHLDQAINIIYISKSRDLLKKAYLSEKSEDRKSLGELLGYPRCCVEFFSHQLKHSKLPFPVKTYIKTRGKPSFLVNNILKLESRLSSKALEEYQKNPDFANRISHLFLISHVPCSYTCKKSIKMGREILDLLKREEPELAEEIVFRLKRPVLYFDDLNWLIFNGKVNSDTISYTSMLPPLSLMPESIVKKFREGDKVKVGEEYIEIFKNNKGIHRIEKKDEYNGILLDFS